MCPREQPLESHLSPRRGRWSLHLESPGRFHKRLINHPEEKDWGFDRGSRRKPLLKTRVMLRWMFALRPWGDQGWDPRSERGPSTLGDVCDVQLPPQVGYSWLFSALIGWLQQTIAFSLGPCITLGRMKLLPENLTFDSMPSHAHKWSLQS